MELPTQYQELLPLPKYYVYVHVDPRTSFPRYVGMGQGSRAWLMRNSKNTGPRYGHRSSEHYTWFQELESLGYTLADIVLIKHKQLTKEQALEIEQEMLSYCSKMYGKLFNEDRHNNWLEENKETIKMVKQLRKEGVSFTQITEQTTIPRMTAWRMAHA